MCRDHRIHSYPSQREGVATLPYAEIFNPVGEYFAEASVRADAQYRSRSTKMVEKTYPSGACHLTSAQRQLIPHSAAKSKTDA